MIKKYKQPEEKQQAVSEPMTTFQTKIFQSVTDEEFEKELERSLSGEEMLERVLADIHELYKNRS